MAETFLSRSRRLDATDYRHSHKIPKASAVESRLEAIRVSSFLPMRAASKVQEVSRACEKERIQQKYTPAVE
jgi:hypothetical protein